MSSSKRGRCSRPCTSSRRDRSPTTTPSSTTRRGARRSRRRCAGDGFVLHDVKQPRAVARISLCSGYEFFGGFVFTPLDGFVFTPPAWVRFPSFNGFVLREQSS